MRIPPCLSAILVLVLLAARPQACPAQTPAADISAIISENILLREQLEHLLARREAFRWGRFPDGLLLRSGSVLQITPAGERGLAFATDDQGLVLFDGTRFEVYDSSNSGLPDNFVTSVVLQGKNLWIGTAAGLASLGPDGNLGPAGGAPDAIATGTISCLLAGADSALWVGTQGAGLWRFLSGDWRQFASGDTLAGPGNINALAPDPGGNAVWAATAGEGLWRVNESGIERFADPLGPGSEEIYTVLTDSDALVWIGSVGAGAGFWDGFGWNRAPLPASEGTGVVSIGELDSGDLFFGTTEGAWFYLRGSNRWDKLPLPEEIATLPVVAAREYEGRLWLAPSGAGVYFYDRRLVTRYDESTGLPPGSVYQINQSPDGRLWFSTFSGVAVYDGRRWSRLDRRSGLPDNLVTGVIFGSGDSTVFATHRGVGILSGGGWSYLDRDHGLLSNTINHLDPAPSGEILISTEGGGLVLAGRDSLRTWTTDHGLPSNQVQAAVAAGGDSIWVATKRGLALISGDSTASLAPRENYSGPLPPAGHFTSLLLEPNGVLWAGSAGDGLWRRSPGGDWQRLGAEDGLGSNDIYAVARHPDGRMLLGTRMGLSMFDGSDWRNLTGYDGLNPGAVKSVFVDADGALWLAGDGDGVLKLDLDRLDPPETYLALPSGVLAAVDNSEIPVWLAPADSSEPGRVYFDNAAYRKLDSAPAQDTLRVDRLTLDIAGRTPWWNSPQSGFSFQWKLDKGPWSEFSTGGAVSVFDLSRGLHTLYVRARGPNLRLDPTPAICYFFVDTPTLLSDWRIWIAALLLAGGGLETWQRKRIRWWVRAIRHRHFRPVTPNPFDPNLPQTSSERFFGRGELLERLDRLFGGEDRGSVIIHGGERIGMTSFLNQCVRRAESVGATAVFIDLADELGGGIAGLARTLVSGLAGEPGADSMEDPLDQLSDLLKTRSEQAVLVIDNAELLCRMIQRDNLSGEKLVLLIRDAILEDAAAGFLFGTGDLDTLRDGSRALFEMSRLYRLGSVSNDEAAEILSRPLEGRAIIHDSALELLCRLSGGQPYLLQCLGRELVEVINREESSLVTLELAGLAVERLVFDPPVMLIDRWEELPKREKLVLAAMCSLREERNGRLGVADISGVLGAHGIAVVDEELAKAAAELAGLGMVELDQQSAAITVPDSLLGRWITSSTNISSIAAREEYDVAEALHRFSDDLSHSFRLEELAGRVLNFFEEVLHCDYAIFYVVNAINEESKSVLLEIVGSEGSPDAGTSLPSSLPAGALEELSLLLESGEHVDQETLAGYGFEPGCLPAPLLARGEPVGLLALGPRRNGERFNRRDRMFIDTCAEQAAVAMENARLYEEETEKERLQQELDTARRMQMAILPPRKPDIPGLDIFAHLNPATEVGGDYFDYKLLDSGQLVFVIGDVSGHGISAGTLVSMSKSCIFNQLRTSHEVAQVMVAMNEMVCGALAERLLMTLCYVVFDHAAGKLIYSIAGHPFPYHVRRADDAIEELDISAYPLGVTRKTSYQTAEVEFSPGDMFVFYSDGIVEAVNPEKEQWGFERFSEVILANAALDAEGLSRLILSEFDKFRRGVPQDDDVTLVTIKVL